MRDPDGGAVRVGVVMGEWISVEARIPMPGIWVILAEPNGVEQGYVDNEGHWWLTRTDSQDDRIEVWPTHWMPLPDPPQD